MSRGSVFKLSGNLALGPTNDTYSTNQLESIKSSLRLLKARQSQKKSQQNINYPNNNNNYGVSYSSNTGQRSELRRNQNKDYNYFQTNAQNHVPANTYSNNQNYRKGYDDPQPYKANSKNSLYDNTQRALPNNINRNRNNDYQQMKNNIRNNDYPSSVNNNRNNDYGQNTKADYQVNSQNKNSYNNNRNDWNQQNQYTPYTYNENKQLLGRNNNKLRTQQFKPFNDQQYSQYQPINQNQQESRPKAQTRPPLRKQQLNQQASIQNHSTNFIQQKPIKQANREYKQQIVEYDPSSFVECSVGCGRKFNPDSISKHEAICYKVFQKKRKQFNAQQQRILDGQHKKIVKNVIAQQKRNTALQKKNQKPNKKDQKMSKWKAQSLAFRAMLKNNKGQEQTAEQRQQMQEIKNIGMVKCPHCGRSFNETAGSKHIMFCQTQSKKNKMKR